MAQQPQQQQQLETDMNKTTGSGGGSGSGTDQMVEVQQILLVSSLISLILISIVGNCLVCVAIFTDRRLRKLGNAFIVSLAIADLFVSCLVMTFALCNDLMNQWIFGDWFCDVWISFDIMCCTASILNLCAISLDRFIHIKDCLLYNQWMTRKVAITAVIAIWFISALVSFVPINLGWHKPPVVVWQSNGGRRLELLANAPLANDNSNQMRPAELQAFAYNGERRRDISTASVGEFFSNGSQQQQQLEEAASKQHQILVRSDGHQDDNNPWPQQHEHTSSNHHHLPHHRLPMNGNGSSSSGQLEQLSSSAAAAMAAEAPAQCMLTLTPTYAVISSTISFYIPCLIMLGLYTKLFACARKHVKNIQAISKVPAPLAVASCSVGVESVQASGNGLQKEATTNKRRPLIVCGRAWLKFSRSPPPPPPPPTTTTTTNDNHKSKTQTTTTTTTRTAITAANNNNNNNTSNAQSINDKLLASATNNIKLTKRSASSTKKQRQRFSDSGRAISLSYEDAAADDDDAAAAASADDDDDAGGGGGGRRELNRSNEEENQLTQQLTLDQIEAPSIVRSSELFQEKEEQSRPFLAQPSNSASAIQLDLERAGSWRSQHKQQQPAAKCSSVNFAAAAASSQHQQQQQQQQQRGQQLATHKAAVTLGIIMGTFLFCWVPFFCLNIIKAFCVDCIPSSLFRAFTWLGYANSALNPIIYGIHNSEFRNAFNRIFFKHLNIKNSRYYLNRRFSGYDLRRNQQTMANNSNGYDINSRPAAARSAVCQSGCSSQVGGQTGANLTASLVAKASFACTSQSNSASASAAAAAADENNNSNNNNNKSDTVT